MKSYQLIGTTLFILTAPVVQSFVAYHTCDITATKLMHKTYSQLAAHGNPLYLHVEALHPHRDSLVRLDDPITEEEKPVDKKNNGLHRFTSALAPIALALYLIGHYLSTYHTSLVDNGSSGIDIDPMYGGYVLIGAGFLMVKYCMDNAFLSPV